MLPIASSTRSSSMSRPRSCRSTICRRSGGIGVRGRLDAEVLERERREVDDPAWLGVEPDGQDRHQRVAGLERAVAAAAAKGAGGGGRAGAAGRGGRPGGGAGRARGGGGGAGPRPPPTRGGPRRGGGAASG